MFIAHRIAASATITRTGQRGVRIKGGTLAADFDLAISAAQAEALRRDLAAALAAIRREATPLPPASGPSRRS